MKADHTHEYEKTDYIQTTYWGADVAERQEWKCNQCPKRKWLPVGTIPSIKKASSRRDSGGQLPNQISLLEALTI